MSAEQSNGQRKIVGDGDVVADESISQIIKAQDGSTISGVIQLVGDYYEALPIHISATAPAPPAHFWGREEELSVLTVLLTTNATSQTIIALQGLGGVGKTALVAQLASQLANTFPGGVFWANIPADHTELLVIMAAWERLCAHATSILPDRNQELGQAANIVRGILTDRVANQGRLLIVLDDVSMDTLEVARVLQSTRPFGVPVLVTTREARVAQALRAKIIHLHTLPPDNAHDLLATLTNGTLTGEDADWVAKLCGYLPLALELAAALAVQEGATWLLTQLKRTSTPLDVLALDGAHYKDESVRLTFDISFRALARHHPETARIFRYLGAFPTTYFGPDFLAKVLAAVGEGGLRDEPSEVKVDEAQIEAADIELRRLVRWALLQRGNEGQGESLRCGLHPLMRDYAAGLLNQTNQAEAIRAIVDDIRFTEWRALYQATRIRVMTFFLEYAEMHSEISQADFNALIVEHANILQAMISAYEHEQWKITLKFMSALEQYLHLQGCWHDAQMCVNYALTAAKRLQDPAAQVHWMLFAGLIHDKLGNYEKAESYYQQSLHFAQAADEVGIQAEAWCRLGWLAHVRREWHAAKMLYDRAIELHRHINDRLGLAGDWRHLGLLAMDGSDFGQAVKHLQTSLDLVEGDANWGTQRLRASVQLDLGRIAFRQGRLEEASRRFEHALAHAEKALDLQLQADIHFHVAMLVEKQGNLHKALEQYQKHLNFARGAGDRRGEISALIALGTLYLRLSDYDRARRYYEQVLTLAECHYLDVGLSHKAIHSLCQLGTLAQHEGRLEEAQRYYQQALDMGKSTGFSDTDLRKFVEQQLRDLRGDQP